MIESQTLQSLPSLPAFPILSFHPSFFHQHKHHCTYLTHILQFLCKYASHNTYTSPSVILFIQHLFIQPSNAFCHQYEAIDMSSVHSTVRLLSTCDKGLEVNSFYELKNPLWKNDDICISESSFTKLNKLNEAYLPQMYTVRQLIQLLHKSLLLDNELFHVVGLFVGMEQHPSCSFLYLKDFEFDERVVILCPADINEYSLNTILLVTDVRYTSTDVVIRMNPQSSIQILSLIPSHTIEKTLPVFIDFPRFSSVFYLWIHVEIELVYKLMVMKVGNRFKIECSFFANTHTQPLHM